MRIDRRNLILSALTLSAVDVAACTTGTGPQTTLVDLPTAQRWAAGVTTVLALAAQQAPPLPPQQSFDLALGVGVLRASNTALQAAVPSADAREVAQRLISGARMILSAVGAVDPRVRALESSIDLALMVLSAFVGSLPIALPPLPPELHT